MKGVYKNRISAGTKLLCTALLFIFLTGCAGLKSPATKTSIKIKNEKEMLVASDITYDRPFWCGRVGLIYNLLGKGSYRHNLKTGRNVKVAEPGSIPLGCTPDGQWLLYIDKKSLRLDEGATERKVVNVWMYEFNTKKRQRFAVAYYDEISSIGSGILAPIDKRFFLGKQPKERVKTALPERDIFWTKKQAGMSAWFHDGKAIVRVQSGKGKDRLLIEVLSPKRESLFLEQKAKHILQVLTDREDNVYMQVSNEEFEPELINEVIRCSVDLRAENTERLNCIPVLENFSVKSFDVFSISSGIAFMEWSMNSCVRVVRREDIKAPCITRRAYNPGFFLDISPDDRWVYFISFRQKEDDTFANDLYVVKLKD